MILLGSFSTWKQVWLSKIYQTVFRRWLQGSCRNQVLLNSIVYSYVEDLPFLCLFLSYWMLFWCVENISLCTYNPSDLTWYVDGTFQSSFMDVCGHLSASKRSWWVYFPSVFLYALYITFSPWMQFFCYNISVWFDLFQARI